MSVLDWAKREIEIACKKENPDLKDGEFDYGCACYQSALKAFKSLCGDGHSGCSIHITKNILNRLIDGKPLVPIEDTDDIWEIVTVFSSNPDIVNEYQCVRMSSLFKTVYADGHVEYHDVNRCVKVDITNDSTWHSGLIDSIIEELHPITMPYMPADKPYKVYCEDFLYDEKNGDYDTVGVLYYISPDGQRTELNKYYKESDAGPMVEISAVEYHNRKVKVEARKMAKVEEAATADGLL